MPRGRSRRRTACPSGRRAKRNESTPRYCFSIAAGGSPTGTWRGQAVEVGGGDEELAARGRAAPATAGCSCRFISVRASWIQRNIGSPASGGRALPNGRPTASRSGRRKPWKRPPEQAVDVALLQPEVAQAVLRQVVGQGLGEEDAVDAAGGGAGDRVDEHARHARPRARSGRRGPRSTRRADARRQLVRRHVGLQGARGEHEVVQLAGDAVHVDGERDAAVADQAEPQLAGRRRRPVGDVGQLLPLLPGLRGWRGRRCGGRNRAAGQEEEKAGAEETTRPHGWSSPR